LYFRTHCVAFPRIPIRSFYQVDGVTGAAAHMGVEVSVLAEELAAYTAAQDGHDADIHGKTVFPAPSRFSTPAAAMEVGGGGGATMYVARVTPVVHYTMGGVAMDTSARALDVKGRSIPGLFVAGEVSAG
jgi:FAD-dependent fumarate reductase